MNAARVGRFFAPASIAIVGASEEGMYPAGILQDLLRYGYAGRSYPVNPKRAAVFGLRCYPSLTALPEVPDLAILIVPRRAVLAVVDEAIALGVGAAIIITAGFAESDGEGRRLEDALRARLRGCGMAAIGPNCAGLASMVSPFGPLVATRLPAPPRAGAVGFASASGALMMALQGIFADAGLGLSRLVSLGNQADVTLSDVLEFMAGDPATQVMGAFVEGIDDGRRFARVAQQAQGAGKPFVVLKSGRSPAGQQAAATHTAALATPDRSFSAVCRHAGVILADDVGDLTRTLHACAAWAGRFPRGRRVALVTQSGGMGSLAADLAGAAGLELPPLPPALEEQLLALPALKGVGALGNPADVRGAAALGSAAAEVVRLVAAAPEFDAVVLLLAKSAVAARELDTARALAALMPELDKPFAVAWAGQRLPASAADTPEPLRILRAAGIPLFEQAGDCLRVLARLAAWQEQRAQRLASPAPERRVAHPLEPDGAEPARLLGYGEAARLLGRYGIRLAPAEVVETPAAAAAAAQRLGCPVALKGISAQHSHKSEAGLVRLGLGTPAAVGDAARDLLDGTRGVDSLLVQAMAAPGVEVLLGVENDAQFGPLLVAGPGGVLVELLDRSALRPAPVTRADAAAMLAETPLARLLRGFRGAPPADEGALLDLMVGLSGLAAEQAARLLSLDMNPVIVHPAGLSVVDVRVQWRGGMDA